MHNYQECENIYVQNYGIKGESLLTIFFLSIVNFVNGKNQTRGVFPFIQESECFLSFVTFCLLVLDLYELFLSYDSLMSWSFLKQVHQAVRMVICGGPELVDSSFPEALYG